MTTEAIERRQVAHQYPLEALEIMWRDFEPSDYNDHRECGYVPTGTHCHVCGKRIGKELTPEHAYQREILDDDHLICLIAGGEQVGKSFTGAMKFFRVLMGYLGEYQHRAANEVAWLVGASYEQTAREFEYIKSWLKMVPQVKFWASEKVDPGEIRISVPNGIFRIKTKSADDGMSALRMESPVIVLLCEAAICEYDTFVRLRSRVARARADFPGYGMIVMISTFEGSVGWYPTLFGKWSLPANRARENAASFSMPSWSNIFVYKGGRKDPEILAMEASLGEDEFQERVAAIPAPPKGRVFERFDPITHILAENAPHDEDEQVLIGIDPGYSGQPSAYAVEVFQKRKLACGNPHWQGIDEIFDWKKQNEAICDMAMNREWWVNLNKRAFCDIAGTYHAGASGPVTEVWKRITGLSMTGKKIGILPGLARLDSLWNTCSNENCGEPVLVLSPNQVGLIAELSGLAHPFDGQSHPYRWATDRTGAIIGKTPDDKYCDAIKATIYLFVNHLGYTIHRNRSGGIRVKKRKREMAYA